MVAIAPFAIDTYLPALPAMADQFGVDIVQLNYTVSTYLIGFGLGQLAGGPIGDQLGRKPIGLVGLVIFILGSLVIAFADSAAQVQWLRPLQALGGGFVASICMAMVRDSYPPTEAAKRFPIVMLVMLAAPLVAPILGTLLLPFGWASLFWFLVAYGLMILVVFARLPETHRARTGKLQLGNVLPQYGEVLTRRVHGDLVPLRYILTQGFVSSGLMVFLTNAAFIYLEYFQVDVQTFPIYFGANVAMMMATTLVTARLVTRYAPFGIFRFGTLAQLASVLALLVLVMTDQPPLVGVTIALACVIGSAGFINSTISGLHLANFNRLAGSAGALMSMSTFTFGALLGALSGWLYDGTLRPIVVIMASAIAVATLICWTTPPPRSWDDEAIAASQSPSKFD